MSLITMETSAATALRAAERERLTGILSASRGGLELRVQLDKGAPVTASSNDAEDRLHGVLLRDDYVSIEDLGNAIRLMLREQRRLGSILVREGYLGRKKLERALITQYSRIMRRFLTTRDMAYRFATREAIEEDVVLHGTANSWIREALSRVTEYRKIFDAVGDLTATLERTPDFDNEVAACEFPPATLREVGRIPDQTTIHEMCHISSLKDFDVLRLSWILLEVGALERRD